jgi:hypothetical protein
MYYAARKKLIFSILYLISLIAVIYQSLISYADGNAFGTELGAVAVVCATFLLLNFIRHPEPKEKWQETYSGD